MKFKSTKLAGLMAALFGLRVSLGRAVTCDVAFNYRMGVGYPGDVNRMHPASIVPGQINTTNPPRLIGDPVIAHTDSTIRAFLSSDAAVTKLYGMTVRSYPTQQQSGGMNATLGGSTAAPTSGVGDYLRTGFIIAKVPAGQTVAKGGAVYVWCAANSGAHVQGGFENAASGGNTAAVTNAVFTGPADASGFCEIEVWPVQ